jgi:thiamine-monophosphate kinase
MSLGEFDIIARYFSRHDKRADVLLGVGDDAAVLDVRADRKQVVAMDTIVEGVHFPEATAAADIGYRALAVNLSDLAAMGAEPAWMTLSLSLPRADEQWLAGFAAGLFELADRHDVALVGGDTVRGPLVITVQIGGWVESGRWLTRSGAQPGDLLFISGYPGEAAAGLAVVQTRIPPSQAADQLRQRFLRPEPRLALGRYLRTIATAAMDVSDGVLTDLEKLCAASHCGAQLNVDSLPLSESIRALFDADTCVDYALAGGDDYELLFTIPQERARELMQWNQPALTQIGVVTAGQGVRCMRDGKPFEPNQRGYDHFARSSTSGSSANESE